MKKIVVLGKPGSGKSTLSKRLALATDIKLYHLDSIEFKQNGERVDRAIYAKEHEIILSNESWIIDGFGPMGLFYQRIAAADTLVYIDLPYMISYWLVTKRFLKGLFVKPKGWPDDCSILKGTIQSYKTLRLCPAFWNRDFSKKLEEMSTDKKLYVLRSISDLNNFTKNM